MKKLNKLKELYHIEENFLYKNKYLNLFANTFLSSNQESKYQLYHQYVFRSDLTKNYIETHYSHLIKNKEFNWDLPELQSIIFDNSSIFVGYIKPKNKKLYRELFLTINDFNDAYYPNYEVSGYTIGFNNINSKYKYLFKNSVDLGYKHLNHIITFHLDIEKIIQEWYKKLLK